MAALNFGTYHIGLLNYFGTLNLAFLFPELILILIITVLSITFVIHYLVPRLRNSLNKGHMKNTGFTASDYTVNCEVMHDKSLD